MTMIKVVIADDHALFRQGLEQLLGLYATIEVIGLANTGKDAIEKCSQLTPDVLLLDVNMPEMNGIDALKTIKQDNKHVKVIMLTIHDEREYLFETMTAGADGYLLKDVNAESLIQAIETVHGGGTYIQPTLSKYFVQDKKTSGQNAHHPLLTTREIDVIELIAEGFNNKDIADHLFISEKTVKNHVSNIFKKINVTDRTQAAIYAIKNNIKKI